MSNVKFSITVIIRYALDQAECNENTQALPQQNQYSSSAKAFGGKNRLKAERARFLSSGEESEA
jgi:hypothetical protein